MSVTKVSSPYALDCATYNESEALKTALQTSLDEAKANKLVSQDAVIEMPSDLESKPQEAAKTSKKKNGKAAKKGALKIQEKAGKADGKADAAGSSVQAPQIKQVVKLEPTTGEAWTAFAITWTEKLALTTAHKAGAHFRGLIEWGIQKQIPENTWQKVTKLNLWDYHTAGELEKVGIQLIDENPDYTDEERVASHVKVKALLKRYVDAGGWFWLVKQQLLG